MDEIIENIPQEPSKLKKTIKWILIVLVCVFWVIMWWVFFNTMKNEEKIGEKIMNGNKCECECLTSSGSKPCRCPEYMCYEKSMKEWLNKCKIRCKIYDIFSYDTCIFTCEHEFKKNWIWIN